MTQTRKQRKNAQRKFVATATQLRNERDKALRLQEQTQQYARNLERRLTSVQQMPSEVMETVLEHAVHKLSNLIVQEMEPVFPDVRDYISRKVQEIEEGMFVRISDRKGAVTVDPAPDGTRITFTFPEFRWTHIVDPIMQRSICRSGRGATYAPDKDIPYLTEPVSLGLPGPDTTVKYAVI